MGAALENPPVVAERLAAKLAFYTGLQSVTNTIHATSNVDEILFEVSEEICNLFGADRLTIYLAADAGASIITKVKTGLNSFRDFRLPVDERSIAGFVALHRRLVNIRDAHDKAELGSHSPHLKLMDQVDAKTGYQTRQLLTAPLQDARTR